MMNVVIAECRDAMKWALNLIMKSFDPFHLIMKAADLFETDFSLLHLLRVISFLGQPCGLLTGHLGFGLEACLDSGHAKVDEKCCEVARVGLAA